MLGVPISSHNHFRIRKWKFCWTSILVNSKRSWSFSNVSTQIANILQTLDVSFHVTSHMIDVLRFVSTDLARPLPLRARGLVSEMSLHQGFSFVFVWRTLYYVFVDQIFNIYFLSHHLSIDINVCCCCLFLIWIFLQRFGCLRHNPWRWNRERSPWPHKVFFIVSSTLYFLFNGWRIIQGNINRLSWTIG